jgi:hypothetical protein
MGVEQEPAVTGGDMVRAGIDVLARVDWDDLDPETLSRLVIELSRLRDRLDGLCHLAVGAHDRVMAWKHDGARSEKEWLASRCGTSMGEAAGRAETARRLAQLPATAQALAEGAISPAHARVATKAAQDLPAEALGGLDALVAERRRGGCGPVAWCGGRLRPCGYPGQPGGASGAGMADPAAEHTAHPGRWWGVRGQLGQGGV